MANFVDVNKMVFEMVKSAVSPVPFYRKVPSDKTNQVPWIQYTILSPEKVSNAAYRRGVTFTLALNFIHSSYPGVVGLVDETLDLILQLPKQESPHGRLSRLEVVTGPEEANTAISSTNHSQLSMTLTGIARKE